MTQPADDEVRQVVVHPAVWPYLENWLRAQRISLALLPLEGDDLPTYVMTLDLPGDGTAR
jgi:hypothetical protein